MVERRNWSPVEVKEALALYLVTDLGRFHSRNPDVIRLAARLDRKVWAEFLNNPMDVEAAYSRQTAPP